MTLAPQSKSQNDATRPPLAMVRLFQCRPKSWDTNRSNAHHLLTADSSCARQHGDSETEATSAPHSQYDACSPDASPAAELSTESLPMPVW